MTSKLTFWRLSRENRFRCLAPGGFNHAFGKWSVAEWTNAIMGEVGEAAEAFLHVVASAGGAANLSKKLIRIRDGVPGNKAKETSAHLRDLLLAELADVVIYADLTAQALGGDLGEAVRSKFNSTSKRIGWKGGVL